MNLLVSHAKDIFMLFSRKDMNEIIRFSNIKFSFRIVMNENVLRQRQDN